MFGQLIKRLIILTAIFSAVFILSGCDKKNKEVKNQSDAVSETQNKLDEQAAKIDELQSIINAQQSKITEQQQTIDLQKASVDSTKQAIKETNVTIAKQKDCTADVARYCYLKMFADKEDFDRAVDEYDGDKKDYYNRNYPKYELCQKAIKCE